MNIPILIHEEEKHYPIQGVPKKLFMYWQSCDKPIIWSITHVPTGMCIKKSQSKEFDLSKQMRVWWRNLSKEEREAWNISYKQLVSAGVKALGLEEIPK